MQAELPPIVQKTVDLTKLLFLKQKNIPKFERHTIWSECCKLAIQVLQGLLAVAYLAPADRTKQLKQVSVRLDTLRVFVRILSECKALDYKSYITVQKEIDEIGKMLGGWLRHSQNNK